MKHTDSSSVVGTAGAPALGVTVLSRSRLAIVPAVRSAWLPLTLGAILVLAAVVRCYHLVQNPPGFFADEASYGYNAYKILHTGRDEFGARLPLFFKAFGEYKLSVYIYSQVPLIALLGLSELSVRLTSAIYGVVTVFAIYLLGRALFDDKAAGVAAAGVLAISPWHIFYSRTGLGEEIVWPFFLTASLYLFLVATRKPVLYPIAAAAFGLTFYSYRPAWVTLPPLLLLIALLYHRELIKRWRLAIASFFVFALVVLPIPLHVISVSSDRAEQESILKLHLGPWGTATRFADQYQRHFHDYFLFQAEGEGNIRHIIPGASWVYVWQVPFLIVGFAGLLWKPTRPKVLTIALLALFPIGTAVTQGSPSSSRSVMGCIPFTLITAYGIVTAAAVLGSWRHRLRGVAVGTLLAGLMLTGTAAEAGVAFASFLHVYHGSYWQSTQGYGGWQWGSHAVVSRFKSLQGQYDQLIMDGSGFNAPDSFFNFFAPGDCRKCTIGHWDHYDPSRRELFAIRPETMAPAYNFDVLEVIYYPNGNVAFVLAEIADGPHVPPGAVPNMSLGSPQNTLEDFQNAVIADPKNPALYVDRGNFYWRLGRFWDAVYDYNKAIDLDPRNVAAYFNRGNLSSAVGIFDLAIGDFGKVHALDKTFAGGQTNSADIYLRVRDYRSALTALGPAQDSDSAIAYADRALANGGIGEFDQALAAAGKAIELDPNSAFAYEARARVNVLRGQLNDALPDFSKALELNAKYGDAYAGRGIAYRRLGDNTHALADLDRALAFDRDDALAYANRGLAYLGLGDVDRGLANLDKAVELDRAFVKSQGDRGRQFQWSLQDIDAGFVDALRQARSAEADPASAARLQSVLDYVTRPVP